MRTARDCATAREYRAERVSAGVQCAREAVVRARERGGALRAAARERHRLLRGRGRAGSVARREARR